MALSGKAKEIIAHMEEEGKKPVSYFGFTVLLNGKDGKVHRLYLKLDIDSYDKTNKEFNELVDTINRLTNSEGEICSCTMAYTESRGSLHSQSRSLKIIK